GYLGFINTNKFFNSEYGKPLRDYLASFRIQEIINFEQAAIFKDALVSSTILLLEKNSPSKQIEYVEFMKEQVTPEKFEIEKIKRKLLFSNEYLKTKSWLFKSPKIGKLLSKISDVGTSFGELKDIKIKRGITTGYDDAFIIDELQFIEFTSIDSSCQRILKPLLKGKHIKRYYIDKSKLWLINSHNGLTGKLKRINLERDYPELFKYINYINNTSRGKVEKRSDKGMHWSNLRNCAFLEEFEKPKVVWGLISGNWSFALDLNKNYLTSASYFLTSNKYHPTVFIALMNSKLFKFYFENVGEMTAGGAYVLKKASIEKFIFPNELSVNQANCLIKTVQSIQLLIYEKIKKENRFLNYLHSQFQLEALSKKLQNWSELEFGEFINELNKVIKKMRGTKLSKMDEMEWIEVFETKKSEAQNLKDKIDKTDQEIDQLVYELYGLSEEEIKVVEGQNRNTN
ncbi:MAG: restriction endonuclease subunit M, partial [Bacteroidetes bacterium]|nr:restriction endonuclease subunit M [Bacteroidota bacterium]